MKINIACHCGTLTYELTGELIEEVPPEVIRALEESMESVFHGVTNAALTGIVGGPETMVLVADAYERVLQTFDELQVVTQLVEALRN